MTGRGQQEWIPIDHHGSHPPDRVVHPPIQCRPAASVSVSLLNLLTKEEDIGHTPELFDQVAR